MQLYARVIGSGPPLLILHGLFGMSDNWVSIANELAENGMEVHIPDLRNHGRSPHADTHRYTDMAEDILEYMERSDIDRADFIGHSMGGKLGMVIALLHPEKMKRLIIVDIAPSDYRRTSSTFHADLINVLSSIRLDQHDRRGTIRNELRIRLENDPLAMFLTKNIIRDETSNNFRWKCNLVVLKRFLQHLYTGLEELDLYAPSPVATLFIKGVLSDYYRPEHESDRKHFFPNSTVHEINDAGHWVHSQQPAAFLTAVNTFLDIGKCSRSCNNS